MIWGRSALPSGSPLPSATSSAIHREIGLARTRIRPPDGLRVRALHRLGPARAGTGSVRRRIRRAVLGGAALELARRPNTERVLDRVLSDAGLRSTSQLRPSSGGGARRGRDAYDRAVVARLAPAGSGADPQRAAQALRTLASADLPRFPGCSRRGSRWGSPGRPRPRSPDDGPIGCRTHSRGRPPRCWPPSSRRGPTHVAGR